MNNVERHRKCRERNRELYTTVTVKLRREIVAEIAAAAIKNGVTKAEIVRRSIELFMGS